jgi:thioredoxin-related protein
MKLFLLLGLIIMQLGVGAQNTEFSQPPFKRFPTLPPIQILLSDSTTLYTKSQLPENKPILFMLFSPECSHCQHETEELIAHKEEFKDIHIVMITFKPLWEMKDFIEKYKLGDLPNVVVGRDIYYTTPSFYNIHNLPFLAMYDKKGNLIDTFEGTLPIENVLKIFTSKAVE